MVPAVLLGRGSLGLAAVTSARLVVTLACAVFVVKVLVVVKAVHLAHGAAVVGECVRFHVHLAVVVVVVAVVV